MSDASLMPAGRAPAAVAEAPVGPLLERSDELAKRWAVALILARPLQEMGDIPLQRIAREGPALAEQTLRALQSEAELRRLAEGFQEGRAQVPPPARGLGALAGARTALAAVQAAEALRGVLWEELLSHLDHPAPRQVAALGDRLAYVCAAALAATLMGEPLSGEPAVSVPEVEAIGADIRVYGPERTRGPAATAVLVDEGRAPVSSRPPARPPARRAAEGRPEGDGPQQQSRARPLPWDSPRDAEAGAEPAGDGGRGGRGGR